MRGPKPIPIRDKLLKQLRKQLTDLEQRIQLVKDDIAAVEAALPPTKKAGK